MTPPMVTSALPNLVDEGCPEVIRALDLTRPALLEASAGTGKTYAIEHLALRILTEMEGVELGQILVLTFTEKATGELKEKIRARLARRISGGGLDEATLARLKEAHLNFDRASVFTIHGFCHRMLRNYAFENRAPFQAELADDGEIYERVLSEEMRSTWLTGTSEGPEGLAAQSFEEDPGPETQGLAAHEAAPGLAGFRRLAARLGIGPGDDWRGKLLRLARAYNPFRGDRLLPDHDPSRILALEEEALSALASLHGILQVTSFAAAEEHALLLALKDAKFSPANRRRSVEALLAEILALSALTHSLSGAAARLSACRDFLNRNSRKDAVRDGFTWMRPASWPPGSAHEAPFEAVMAALDRIRAALAACARERRALEFETQREVIHALRARARDEKRLRGVMGFDDMIEDLCAALRKSPDLVRALRRQFRFCIVDEFQDTDPLQWEIFRAVFLQSDGANPLYLIGDPKQAIYGFRGGDVFTYLSARQDLFALSRDGKARGLSLDANFRSSRAMVEACNAVFADPAWFRVGAPVPGDETWKLPPEADPLGYLPVRHGGLPIQECLEEGAPGSSGGALEGASPIILRDFSAQTRKGPCQRKINQWVTSEIRSLMSRPDRLRIPDGAGSFRPLDWGDICVILRTNREKRLMETLFQKCGIPFQVHKRVGLYQSGAAAQFLALFESLEDPRDKGKHARALLTRFFRAPADPPPAGLPSQVHPAFEGWSRLAQGRKWQRLFHSLLYGTGLLNREALESDGERRVMDFLHLAQNLTQEALRDNLSLAALTQRLGELREEIADGEEERHLHREDSESRKVILMTMHTSKGLEFPVVFLAGLSGSMANDYHRYHEQGCTVFHLDKRDGDAARLALSESEDEEKRLYYVALTRARYKLYLPLPPPKFGRSTSPLGGFVAAAVRAAAKARPALFRLDGPAGEGTVEVTPSPSSASLAAPLAAPASGSAAIDAKAFLSDFVPDPSLDGADFTRRRRRLSSYSHLVSRAAAVATEDLQGRHDKEDAGAAHPEISEEEDASGASAPPGNALPRGRETGNMFHEILENVDFPAVAAAASVDALLQNRAVHNLIASRMRDHRLEETHLGDVARVIWHALRAPLPDPAGGEAFRLGDVADRLPEMEFLFPETGGYLGGYMDLVFRRRGRYYLLDWKSNWLEAYGPAAVAADIVSSRYDLQYMLYALALDKWLRSLSPSYDYGRDFGGIYYLYLRGMDASAAGSPGVFALKPAPAQMKDEFPERLRQALGSAGMVP
jgi:exodeoxyribonuclease V beta subunit